MTAARQPPRRRLDEQLIGAVIPTPLPRPAPPSAPMPELPAAVPPAREPVDDIVFDVARPDADGRVAARALGWPSGHRLHVDVTDGLLLITARPDGKHTVGARGALPLPVAARQMCGITSHQVVLLAAVPARDLLVVHPSNTITRLLAERHAAVLGGTSHVG